MGEDEHATRSERRGEIPVARLVESIKRATLAHRLVLGAIECMDLLTQLVSVDYHRKW